MAAIVNLQFDTRSLVIGKGQIGSSLYNVLKKRVSTFVRDKEGPEYSHMDVLHICFPYSEHFISQVRNYIEKYDPALTIVYSTVPIGTCEKIGTHIVHSPIEGRHPNLEDSISLSARWLGSADDMALTMATYFWTPFVKMVRTTPSASYTEFLKLRSTAKYGINLVWTDYEAQLANMVGVKWRAVKDYDTDYNELYRDIGESRFQRYILDPPNGVISGHCIVPNSEILDKQYPHPLLKMIKKMKGKK